MCVCWMLLKDFHFHFLFFHFLVLSSLSSSLSSTFIPFPHHYSTFYWSMAMMLLLKQFTLIHGWIRKNTTTIFVLSIKKQNGYVWMKKGDKINDNSFNLICNRTNDSCIEFFRIQYDWNHIWMLWPINNENDFAFFRTISSSSIYVMHKK